MCPEDARDDEMEFEYNKVDERKSQEQEDEPETEEAARPEPEAEATEDTSEAEGADEAAEAAATEQAAAQVMSDMDIYTVLRMMIGMVAEQAWISLGLRVADGQEEPKLDLDQARIAIDTLEFIQGKLAAQLSEEENREMKALISNLQVNFVRKS